VDFLAISFVRDANIISNVRSYVKAQLERRHPGHRIDIVAKIEAYDSIAQLPAIIDAADGIMVARSDLGAQIPLEDVPAVQKEIVFRCRQVRGFSIPALCQHLITYDEMALLLDAAVLFVLSDFFNLFTSTES
jgi:pyruvate kinase